MSIFCARALISFALLTFSPVLISALQADTEADSLDGTGTDPVPPSLSDFVSERGFPVREMAPGFSGKEERVLPEQIPPPLAVVSMSDRPFSFEEKEIIAEHFEKGGSLLLVALTCEEKEEMPGGEAALLNDLLSGMSDMGMETGFRFETPHKSPLAGRVFASMPGDPVIREVQNELEEMRFPGGYALTIDSSLNPSVRAFSLVDGSGERWPFLALAPIGKGKIAAFGAGASLQGCPGSSEEILQPEPQVLRLLTNVLSWLTAGGGAMGDSVSMSPRIIVSEIMWGGDAAREYIELYNPGDRDVDIEGWTLTDGEGVCIVKGHVPPGSFYLLEYDELATTVMADEVYGDDSPELMLEEGGDRISLLDRWGDVVALVNGEETAWPAGLVEGHGASMELIDIAADYGPSNWRSSVGGDIVPWGTPRELNSTDVITPFTPDFRASVKEGGIELEWNMENPAPISHFNLYRSVSTSSEVIDSTGTFTRITPLPLAPDSTRFLDTGVDSSLTYRYLLGVTFTNGTEYFSEPLVISLKWLAEPRQYAVTMGQNFPNPFNPNTEVRFEIKDLEASGKAIEVSVLVYSPRGHVVRRLFERQTYPGVFSARWDGRDENGEELGSGAYYYQLLVRDSETGQVLVRLSRKMVLMR
jgi:hypothetical protein